MPLARAALYAQGETLHVAHWPGGLHNTEDLTRVLAREGRSFVLSACGVLRGADFPAAVPERERILGAAGEGDWILNGGSCIAGPDGKWCVEPVVGSEQLIVCDLDFDAIRRERQNFDPSGHYARPDVTKLVVDRTRQRTVDFHDE